MLKAFVIGKAVGMPNFCHLPPSSFDIFRRCRFIQFKNLVTLLDFFVHVADMRQIESLYDFKQQQNTIIHWVSANWARGYAGKVPKSISGKPLVARLRELRKRNALTQEKFSEISGVSYKYYQLIEIGLRIDLRLSTLEKMAKAYGIGVHELLAPNFPKVRQPKSHSKKSKTWFAPKNVKSLCIYCGFCYYLLVQMWVDFGLKWHPNVTRARAMFFEETVKRLLTHCFSIS